MGGGGGYLLLSGTSVAAEHYRMDSLDEGPSARRARTTRTPNGLSVAIGRRAPHMSTPGALKAPLRDAMDLLRKTSEGRAVLQHAALEIKDRPRDWRSLVTSRDLWLAFARLACFKKGVTRTPGRTRTLTEAGGMSDEQAARCGCGDWGDACSIVLRVLPLFMCLVRLRMQVATQQQVSYIVCAASVDRRCGVTE